MEGKIAVKGVVEAECSWTSVRRTFKMSVSAGPSKSKLGGREGRSSSGEVAGAMYDAALYNVRCPLPVRQVLYKTGTIRVHSIVPYLYKKTVRVFGRIVVQTLYNPLYDFCSRKVCMILVQFCTIRVRFCSRTKNVRWRSQDELSGGSSPWSGIGCSSSRQRKQGSTRPGGGPRCSPIGVLWKESLQPDRLHLA
jgi:hypothetical protein